MRKTIKLRLNVPSEEASGLIQALLKCLEDQGYDYQNRGGDLYSIRCSKGGRLGGLVQVETEEVV